MAFPYFKLVFGFSVISYFVETYLKLRQYRNYSVKKVPADVKDIVDQETFEKSQAYGRDRSRFGLITDAIDIAEELIFLSIGGLAWAWEGSTLMLTSLGFEESNWLVRYLILFVVALLVSNINSLPQDLYATFVIEERHGFNKKTFGLYVMDQLKGTALTLVIGTPVFLLLAVILKWSGSFFWIYVTVFILAVQLILMALYPILIAPLFNRFLPFPEGDLRTKIEALAQRVNFPLKKLFQMDGSRRSGHSNAFFFGLGKNKRIVLYDTLMEQLGEDDLLAVLGHEFGHWIHMDLWRNIALSSGYILSFMFVFSRFIYSLDLYNAFGFSQPEEIIGIALFGMVFSPFEHLLSLVMNIHSRWCEYRADAFSASLGLDLKPALLKITTENKSDVKPDWMYSAYFYSHPTLLERLNALEKIAKKSQ